MNPPSESTCTPPPVRQKLLPMTPNPDASHRARMQELAAFTAASFDTPYPSPFGCAIYADATGELLAQAVDTVLAQTDPTSHAEINAIRAATRKRSALSLHGCTLYSTCEPCPMCMSAAIWAEIDTVVYGADTLTDADRYWPQASDLAPQDLAAHMRTEPRCRILPHIERALCQDLFLRCDAARQRRGLELPPHR